MKKTTFKNTNISYTDNGEGKTVVLLHGFLENKLMWKNYIGPLSKNFRIITVDLLGHGGTECMGYIHTVENNAEIVNHILNELNISNCSIIGHSMGGYVGLAFAELYSKKIDGLVLLNSTAKEDSPERKQNRTRAIKAVKQNFNAFVSMSIANLFSPANRTRLSKAIEIVKQEAAKTPLQGVVASLEGMKIRKDRVLLLHQATFPIFLILGEKDPVLNYEETIQQIENTKVKLVTFPDGHMTTIENKNELNEVLLDFMKKI